VLFYIHSIPVSFSVISFACFKKQKAWENPRKGKERKGKERKGKERKGKERKGESDLHGQCDRAGVEGVARDGRHGRHGRHGKRHRRGVHAGRVERSDGVVRGSLMGGTGRCGSLGFERWWV
jgi:hypothetical protein